MQITDQEGTFGQYLVTCAAELGFGIDRIRLLVGEEADAVAKRIQQQFGRIRFPFLGTEPSCSLPEESRQLDDSGWRHVNRIVPCEADGAVWFVAENWGGGNPLFIIFETSPAVIQGVLGNSHQFEYLIVSKDMDWLVAENHHGFVSAVGAAAIERLHAILE